MSKNKKSPRFHSVSHRLNKLGNDERIEQLFKVIKNSNDDYRTSFETNLILNSPDQCRTSSISQRSSSSFTSKSSQNRKNSKNLNKAAERRISRNSIGEDRYINGDEENNSDTSEINSTQNEKSLCTREQPEVPIDYDKFLPEQKCADLASLTYANDTEKYLITRIYCNLNKLSAVVSDLDTINVKHFLSKPDQNDCLPLYYAIKAGSLSCVKFLVDLGSSLESTTRNGDPALHVACLVGCSVELLDYFLSFESQRGLYKIDQEGWTILHCCCNQGHLKIVKYLIEAKHMNPNVKDSKSSFTGLQLAVINNRRNVIDYFLSFHSLSSLDRNSSHVANKQHVSEEEKRAKIAAKRQALAMQIAADSQQQQQNPAPPPPTIKSSATTAGSRSKLPVESSSKLLLESSSILSNGNKFMSKTWDQFNVPSKLSFKFSSKEFNLKDSLTSSKEQLADSSKITSSQNTSTKLKKLTSSSEQSKPPQATYLLSKQPSTKKVSIESSIHYFRDLRSNSYYMINEPLAVYNHYIVDLNSKNNEGKNVLHLACMYGKFDVVNLLLKKFGSNQLNINQPDFKGRTCLDLAWAWLVNLNSANLEEDEKRSSEPKTSVSFFFDGDNSFYVQRNQVILSKRIDVELKLLDLLSNYGAKFSSLELLTYDVSLLRLFARQHLDSINLPSEIFHPNDHVSFQDLSLQPESIVPIEIYLKCLLHVLKLNLPTMYLDLKSKSTNKIFNVNGHNKKSSTTRLNRSNEVNHESLNYVSFSTLTLSNYNFKTDGGERAAANQASEFPSTAPARFYDYKASIEASLRDLVDFVQENVIDSFEKDYYYKCIGQAFQSLAKY